MRKPNIALTMGDPAGVGPELILRALAEESLTHICRPFVFGDAQVLQRCAEELNLPQPHVETLAWSQLRDAPAGCPPLGAGTAGAPLIVDLQSLRASDVEPGRLSAACGAASYAYIQAAIDAAQAGWVQAVTTAPINKEALRAAGVHYPGHTEMFAERAAAERWCMMQYSPEITCSFVTVHVGYAEVPALLTQQRIVDTIELTATALRKIQGHEPKLVVCGLNPHAGEHGLFGNREEERLIIPAIEQVRRHGMLVEGPLPPDTAFLPAKRAVTDGFICMYHDQGHIPVKALAFETAVNTTLGLSLIRTSVDHGTAFDIAWRGVANPSSLFTAIRLACRLTMS